MPPTSKQRTLVWLGLLALLIYLVASRWHSLRHGIGGFFPFEGPMLVILFVAVARHLYWPPAPPPRWVEALIWAATSALVLFTSVSLLRLRHVLGWKTELLEVLMIVFIAVWGYSLLYPHGKLWRAFHPAEWGLSHENHQR